MFATKREFVYGGRRYYAGELIEPQGLRNDAALFALGGPYIRAIGSIEPCVDQASGRQFMDTASLRAYQERFGTEVPPENRPKPVRKRPRTGLADVAEDAGHFVDRSRSVPTIVME